MLTTTFYVYIPLDDDNDVGNNRWHINDDELFSDLVNQVTTKSDGELAHIVDEENQWVCVCVILPQLHLMCSNNGVVLLQPMKGTNPYLWSVVSITPFILACPPHLFQPFFWIALFTSSILSPPPSVTVYLRINCLCCTHYPLPLPARNAIHLGVFHTLDPTASAARLFYPRHMPASAAVYRKKWNMVEFLETLRCMGM